MAPLTCSPNVMKIAMLVTFTAAVVLPRGKSDPNMDVQSLLCNSQSYPDGDPFDNSVQYVVAALMNETPSQDGYNYYTTSPYPTSVAYGHATCTGDLVTGDCANCLATARSTILSGCYRRIGAQVVLGDCTMRYENYSFS